MMVVEIGDDLAIVDAGVMFPEDDMPGVDLVIPDTTYLMENASRVKAIFLTHGHGIISVAFLCIKAIKCSSVWYKTYSRPT